MNKRVSNLIFALLTSQLFYAQGIYTHQLDSIHTNDYDKSMKLIFEYTDEGNLKTETTYEKGEGHWLPSEMRTYTYNNEGRMVERKDFVHAAPGFPDEWIAECTYTYKYDEDGRLASVGYNTNEPDYRFDFPYTQVYEYNAGGQLTHISETGVTAENTKRKTADITFEYNQSGRQTCMTHIKHHQDRDEEYMKVEHTYDKSGNLTTLRLLMFGKPVGIKTYEYDEQRRLTHYAKSSGNGTTSIYHTLYYDDSNNIIADYTANGRSTDIHEGNVAADADAADTPQWHYLQATSYMYDPNINKKEVCGLEDYLSRYKDYDFKYSGLEQLSESAITCRYEAAPTTKTPQTDFQTRYYISRRH